MTSTARQSSFALCIIAWFALLLQLNLSVGMTAASGKPALMGIVIYLGYFTVLTNLFVALALLLPLVAPDSGIGRFAARPTVQGCAVNSILLVGIGYHLLLRHVWNPQGMQWIADMLLHYVMPILFLSALAAGAAGPSPSVVGAAGVVRVPRPATSSTRWRAARCCSRTRIRSSM